MRKFVDFLFIFSRSYFQLFKAGNCVMMRFILLKFAYIFFPLKLLLTGIRYGIQFILLET